MYNRTEQRWLESTYSAVGEGKVLFSRNVKLRMFWLGIVPKEIFLTYSIQFVFLTIRHVPENVVMVAIDTYGKTPSRGSGYMELRENMCVLIFWFFLL